MRTTLTLDDDLAGRLKERARELGISFKEMVNRAIRSGLAEQGRPPVHKAPRTRPHRFGPAPGVDLDKLGQLADEFEAEAAATHLAVAETRRGRDRR